MGKTTKPRQQNVLSSIKDLKGKVYDEYSVKTIGVFGSVARNEETEQSDIDLLVGFSRPGYAKSKFDVSSLLRTFIRSFS